MGVFNCEFDSRPAINVGSHQGVYTDGNTFWVTSADGANHQLMLRHYDSNWNLILERSTISDVPVEAQQINGLSMKNGILYVGCNNHNTTPAKGWILEYDPITLTLLATHPTEDFWCEGGAWVEDEFFAVYHNLNDCSRYNSSFTLQQRETLGYITEDALYYQGAIWNRNYFFCNNHQIATWPHTCDVYQYNGSIFSKAGRMLIPTYESDTGKKSVQGLSLDPNGNFMYWAERLGTGAVSTGPHNVVKSTFNKVPNPASSYFWDELNIYSPEMHLKMLEQSGSSLADATGNGHIGTLTGGEDLNTRGDILGFTKNADGRGISLDNTDYISIPHNAGLSTTISFTFGMFIFQHEFSALDWFFGKGVGGEAAADNHNYALLYDFLDTNKFDFTMEESDGTNHTVSSTTTPLVGKAYFVVCVYDSISNELRMYVNGVKEATTSSTFTPNTNTHPVVINGVSDGTLQTKMNVFEPFFINSALTDTNVTDLWNASQRLPITLEDRLQEDGTIRKQEDGIITRILEGGPIAIIVSDTFSGSDVMLVNKDTKLIDLFSGNDIVQNVTNVIQSETLSFNDNVQLEKILSLLETMSSNDQVITSKDIVLVEGLTFSDVLLQTKDSVLVETFVANEVLVSIKNVVLQESLASADVILVGREILAVDSVSFADSVLKGGNHLFADSMSSTESLLTAAGKLVTDVFSGSDVAIQVNVGGGNQAHVISDSIGYNDVVVKGAGHLVTESFFGIDLLVNIKDAIVVDAVSFNDVLFFSKNIVVSDNESFADTLNTIKDNIVNDVYNFTDNVVTSKNIIISGVINYVDNVIQVVGQQVHVLNDVFSAIENVITNKNIFISENFSFTDISLIVKIQQALNVIGIAKVKLTRRIVKTKILRKILKTKL